MEGITPQRASALLVLRYIRDLITVGERETYSRAELLIILDLIGHDPELFPEGLWEKLDSEQEEPETGK
jgi:hypothetical protein